jgi:hypothetical protein
MMKFNGITKPATASFSEQRFWQQVYVAAIRAGHGVHADQIADNALIEFRLREADGQ